jgi:hypothetical protein
MTPLFAATQLPSSSSQVSVGSLSMDVTDGGQLRATQNPQFSLTQTTGGAGATAQTYDWLNPSSLVSEQNFGCWLAICLHYIRSSEYTKYTV